MRPFATEVIANHDRAVAEWVTQHLERPIEWTRHYVAIGIASDGDLIAGVVFDELRFASIEATIASTTPAWCSRRNLAALFAYPFAQLGCTRVGATTEVTNQPARAFLCRLGFRQEGLLHQALPPAAANPAGDAVVYGMTRGECRWLSLSRNRRGNSDVERVVSTTAIG